MPSRHSHRRRAGLLALILALGLVPSLMLRRPPAESAPASSADAARAPVSEVHPAEDIPLPLDRATAPVAPPATYDSARLDRWLDDALAVPLQEERHLLLRELAGFLARHDPDRGLAYVQRLLASGSLATRSAAYVLTQRLTETLVQLNPERARDWSERSPVDVRDVAVQTLLRHWTATDPNSAGAWTLSLTNPELQATAYRALHRQLLDQVPPPIGAAWAARLAALPQGAAYAELIAELWSREDPDAAWAWARQLPADARDGALSAVIGQAASRAPEATAQWSLSLPPGTLRTQAVHRSLTHWADRDPSAAAEWVSTQSANAPEVLAAAPQILARWFGSDPEAARRWLDSAPLAPEQRSYLGRLARSTSSPSP